MARMRSVRVAVNAEQLLYRSPGGIGRYTAQLLTVLPGVEPVALTARHRRADVESALLAYGVGPEVARSARISRLPRPLLYDGWHRIGLPPLPRTDAQVVHAPSVAVPPRSGVPLVVTVHDAAPELFPEAFPPRGRRFHRNGMVAAASRADLVITVSEAAADEILTHSAITADRIRVVHNGVDPPPVLPAHRTAVRRRFGLGDRPFVLWVGSLEPRKGVATVVEAMADVVRRGRDRDAALVLAGFPGWLSAGPVGGAHAQALGQSLVVTGRVGEEALWALYAEATVFAFPSVHEGFGLPVLEAMSQGTAVVASDIPAVREVAGDAALLVPPGDTPGFATALEALLDDEAERVRREEAGRHRAAMFGLDRMAASTVAVYREVAS